MFAILSTYVILLKYDIYMLFWSDTCVCASEKLLIADFYWTQGPAAAPNEESYSYANFRLKFPELLACFLWLVSHSVDFFG